jgi:uncharacterized OB-fold protein
MEGKKQLPIDPDLFIWPSDDPHLIGSKCLDCGDITFPSQESGPKCGGDSTRKIELATRGTLWTWTSQGFRPKTPPYRGEDTPETFKPYFIGYVELPKQLRVESRLLVEEASQLAFGMEMELVIVPFRRDEDGNEIMTYAFQPVV